MVSPLGESGNLVPMVSLIKEVLENIGEWVIHCFRKTAVRDVNESGSTVSTNKNCLLQRSVKDSQKKLNSILQTILSQVISKNLSLAWARIVTHPIKKVVEKSLHILFLFSVNLLMTLRSSFCL